MSFQNSGYPLFRNGTKLMKNVICGAVLAIIKSDNMLYNIYLRVSRSVRFPIP